MIHGFQDQTMFSVSGWQILYRFFLALSVGQTLVVFLGFRGFEPAKLTFLEGTSESTANLNVESIFNDVTRLAYELGIEQDVAERRDFIRGLIRRDETSNSSFDLDHLMRRDRERLDTAQHLQELRFFLLARLARVKEGREGDIFPLLKNNPAIGGLRKLSSFYEEQVERSEVAERRAGIQKEFEDNLNAEVSRLQNRPGNASLLCMGQSLHSGGYAYRLRFASYCLQVSVGSKQGLILQKPETFTLSEKYVNNGAFNFAYEHKNHDLLKMFVPGFPVALSNRLQMVSFETAYKTRWLSQARKLNFTLPPHIPRRVWSLPRSPEGGSPAGDFRPRSPLLDQVTHTPLAWYSGLLTDYLSRPSQYIETWFNKSAKAFGLEGRRPLASKARLTAGIHARRGNKIVDHEGPGQPVWKYMLLVEDFFCKWEDRLGRPLERRVFIATDDPSVILDAKRDYPQYTVLANLTVAENAQGNNSNCYNYQDGHKDSLGAMIVDLMLLRRVDFLVCTFSSNIGSLLYELRAADSPMFGPLNTLSLDIDWYVERQIHSVHYEAIQSHNSSQDNMSFLTGDLIHSTHRQDVLKLGTRGWEYMASSFPDGTFVGKVTRSPLLEPLSQDPRVVRKRIPRQPWKAKMDFEYKFGIVPRFKLRRIDKDLADESF